MFLVFLQTRSVSVCEDTEGVSICTDTEGVSVSVTRYFPVLSASRDAQMHGYVCTSFLYSVLHK